MKKKHKHNSKILSVIFAVLAILLIAGGIFIYYNLFRQNNATLIETVPTDAHFVMQVNDNEPFVKTATQLAPHLNELFSLHSFAGFQSFIDKISPKYRPQKVEIIISGHFLGDEEVLLYSTKMGESSFKKLLKTLKIDPRNCTTFENEKIYSYGTHFSKYFFVCHHNVFSASENLELLQKSILQHRQITNLTDNQAFSAVYQIVEKNDKQNWLFVHHDHFLARFVDRCPADLRALLQKTVGDVWSAFQMSSTESELKLSGYVPDNQGVTEQSTTDSVASALPILPTNTQYFVTTRAATTTTFFVLPADTVSYRYFTLPVDSAATPFTSLLLPHHTADSVAATCKNFAIYQTNCAAPALPLPLSPHFFLENGAHYIFSDSLAALQFYVNSLQSKRLDNAPNFHFVAKNLPSDFATEFVYFTDNQRDSAMITEKMAVIGCSRAAAVNRFCGTTIYLKFHLSK